MEDVRPPYRQEHRHEAVNRPQPVPQNHESPAPPSKTSKKSRKKPIILSLVTLLVLIGLGAGGWFYLHRNNSPIPENIKTQAGFAIYYPSSIPDGYTYDRGSANINKKIVSYSLSSGNNKIIVSEESVPSTPPDLSALQKFNPSFKDIDAPAGKAVSGIDSASGRPVAIIETNTTLINISGSKGVPADVISNLIQNMSSLPQ